ncbi:MAG: ribose 5-phosphate isomerase A [Candidatus Diapherotrites archaeon]
MDKEKQKENSAREAVKSVKKGMIIGLGTGSTAEWFVKILAERNKKEKLGLTCVVTSNKIDAMAKGFGLKVVPLSSVEKIDAAFDGADQVDSKKNLLKGMGGFAFLREKEVDYKAEKLIIMVDESKVSKVLDKEVLLEVEPEALHEVLDELLKFDAEVEQATDNCSPKISENKNYIMRLKFHKPLSNPAKTEKQLDSILGVKANGIFSKKCTVIIGTDKRAKLLK